MAADAALLPCRLDEVPRRASNEILGSGQDHGIDLLPMGSCGFELPAGHTGRGHDVYLGQVVHFLGEGHQTLNTARFDV